MRLSLSIARRALGLVPLVVLGCAADFDTSRQIPPRGTLGRELFTVVCERVGAQSLREDVTGASFDAMCHRDAVTGKEIRGLSARQTLLRTTRQLLGILEKLGEDWEG